MAAKFIGLRSQSGTVEYRVNPAHIVAFWGVPGGTRVILSTHAPDGFWTVGDSFEDVWEKVLDSED